MMEWGELALARAGDASQSGHVRMGAMPSVDSCSSGFNSR